MSVLLAAGCTLSSSQSVSVVPMIQCRPHGMTNSTLFSVRRIRPGVELDAITRDDEVHAFRRADVEPAAAAGHLLGVIGPDASGVDDLLRADHEFHVVVSTSMTRAPTICSPSRTKPMTRAPRATFAPR